MSDPTCTVCRGTERYPVYTDDGVQVAEAVCTFCCEPVAVDDEQDEAA